MARHRDSIARLRIAVIVPNWNTGEYLDRCLTSVRNESAVETEVVVVDNGSRDRSVEFLERAGVRHIALPENIGFAAAVNLGAQNTQAPLVLVLNADVELESECLGTLAATLERDATLAGVQPKILEWDSSSSRRRIYSAGQGLTTAASAFEIGRGRLDGGEYGKPGDLVEVFGVCGAVCLLKRELFDDLGGYDERYFAFYEDVDLNARARLAGWHFGYVPAAVARHVGHAAWGNQTAARAFNVRLTMQNRALTAVKVLPVWCLPWVMVATIRSLLASPFKQVGRAALSGTLAVLPRLPETLHERARLRSRGGRGLDPWLTRRWIDPIGRR